MWPKVANYVGEKYLHGVLVGFGIITANRIWGYMVAIGSEVRGIDWLRVREKAKNNPDAVWNWRKS